MSDNTPSPPASPTFSLSSDSGDDEPSMEPPVEPPPILPKNTAVQEEPALSLQNSTQKDDAEPVDEWLAYKNDDGKMYFYNEKTEENVWELPKGVDRYIDMEDERVVVLGAGEQQSVGVEAITTTGARTEMKTETETATETRKRETTTTTPAPSVNPLTAAMEFLEEKDAVLEPNCMKHVAIARENGANQEELLKALVKGYVNVPGEIGIMASWLRELEGDTEAHRKTVKDSVTGSIEACLKENFTEEVAQQILDMEGSELGWVGEMLKNEDWMRMLIRLQKNNKDSALLTYFLTQISKLGHHHLLLNQTDNFLVFNNMLENMLLKLANATTVAEGDETLGTLRKICLSMPHVFWYSKAQLKALLQNEATPEAAREKFQTLYDELNLAAQTGDIDLGEGGAGEGGVGVEKRRRATEMSLFLSDLQQEARKRRKSEYDSELPKLLHEVVRRRALRISQDENTFCRLESIVGGGEGGKENNVRRARSEPVATMAFFECIFSPGGGGHAGAAGPGGRRLFKSAVAYLEKVCECEEGGLGEAAVACEKLESVVKFTPRVEGEGAEADIVKAARKSWAAGVGIIIWGKLFVSNPDFPESAGYPTFVPGLLQLTRLVAQSWPEECAPACLNLVSCVFLQNPALGGGKDGATGCTEKQNRGIKEQCLRLLLFLMPWGWTLVLRFLTQESLKGSDGGGGSNLDESLIRYFFEKFVGAYGGGGGEGFDAGFIAALKKLLRTEGVNTALGRGVAAATKAKLKTLLNAK
ncbi:hypothetical protein TrVE_jg6234 [Triparma verrucosa]|uniref:WW domain-containing protein n=1 Tax=Triparma verrucosa TaxID=1606542 RepID=A0A9W7C301_9STRA|nr:hypothetical protein TrVE_jg6234 [Triparma verrucosa]